LFPSSICLAGTELCIVFQKSSGHFLLTAGLGTYPTFFARALLQEGLCHCDSSACHITWKPCLQSHGEPAIGVLTTRACLSQPFVNMQKAHLWVDVTYRGFGRCFLYRFCDPAVSGEGWGVGEVGWKGLLLGIQWSFISLCWPGFGNLCHVLGTV
jgi:hypothetical protein